MQKRITLDDIAQAAGVSKQTVSRALNDKGEIDPDTKDRILKIASDFRYRPNHLARAFHTQQTHLVGLLVPDIANPFFAEVARGVQDAAVALDYHAIICNTDENAQTEIELMEHLASQGIDGLITFTTRAPLTQIIHFADSFRPIVTINRRIQHPSIYAVMSKNRDGAKLAVEQFIREGRKHPGMLASSTLPLEDSGRVKGFTETFAKHGLPVGIDQLSQGLPTLSGGYEAAKNLLAVHPETDAIFTYNDLMALGAIRACHELQRRIPQDISIIGFDDIQLAGVSYPALSTIRIDKRAMGQKAFERVLQAIEAPDKPFTEVELDVELIARESTLAV